MKNNLKITALLTARGNNTLKDKNIRMILGKPLLYYPAISAKNSNLISSFYVSSDDEKILEIANKIGYTKIKRPDELALPNAQHVDSITHALSYIKEKDEISPDILVVLLGNCATIKTQWINDCIQEIINDDSISAVVPVMKNNDYHPFRAKKLSKEGFLDTFFNFEGQKISTNRQDLEPCYFLCHNFWVLNIKNSIYSKTGQQPWTFMGEKIKPYIVDESFDVHDEDDLIKSEKWIIKNDQH